MRVIRAMSDRKRCTVFFRGMGCRRRNLATSAVSNYARTRISNCGWRNGRPQFSDRQRSALEERGIRVMEEPVAALEGEGDALRGIRFRNGEFLARAALFFSPGQRQRCPLAEELGCKFCEDERIACQ